MVVYSPFSRIVGSFCSIVGARLRKNKGEDQVSKWHRAEIQLSLASLGSSGKWASLCFPRFTEGVGPRSYSQATTLAVWEDEGIYRAASLTPSSSIQYTGKLSEGLITKMQVRERSGAKFDEKSESAQLKTLGHLRLRDEETNEVILVPTPSDDPKDPLNW
jgi:hypothetical protein